MSLLHVVCFLFVCFVCFKQKTAYEMRISDWSSDVCSSDLPTLLFAACLAPVPGLAKPPPANEAQTLTAAMAGEYALRAGRLDEIGRAACRERVCQYV